MAAVRCRYAVGTHYGPTRIHRADAATMIRAGLRTALQMELRSDARGTNDCCFATAPLDYA
jgi:hypothetical protein